MEQYTGTKTVLARPMTRGEYNEYRGWFPPKGEDQSVEGMLVEYTDGGKPNHENHEGYISWSPADVFHRAYHKDNVSTESTDEQFGFNVAITALKSGLKVSRSGWNGKGMYLYLVGPGRYPPSTPAGEEIAATQSDHRVPYAPYVAMKTVSGEVVPWLASQTDLLSEDWNIIK